MSTENTYSTPYASTIVPGGEVRSIDWLVIDPDEETPWPVCQASLKVFVPVKKFTMSTDGRRLFTAHDALPLKAQTSANCTELAPLLRAGAVPLKALDADRRRFPSWHLNNVAKVDGGHLLDVHVELQWEV
jgi:hypothetical protein